MANKINIPDKCYECGKRRPRVARLEESMDRSFKINTYIKCICNECDALVSGGAE